jgi:hypothetical protein
LYPVTSGTSALSYFVEQGYLQDYPLCNIFDDTNDPVIGLTLDKGQSKLCKALAFSFGETSYTCNSNNVTYTEINFDTPRKNTVRRAYKVPTNCILDN